MTEIGHADSPYCSACIHRATAAVRDLLERTYADGSEPSGMTVLLQFGNHAVHNVVTVPLDWECLAQVSGQHDLRDPEGDACDQICGLDALRPRDLHAHFFE